MPSRTIGFLRQDHANFSRILTALEHQVDAAVSGGFSLELLQMICAYFHDYPRQVHHPKEDLIYSAMVLRAPNNASNLFHVQSDHRDLAEHLEPFEQAVQALVRGDWQSEEILRHQARCFIEYQLTHMRLEEMQLFPDALRTLGPEDWAAIDRFMASESDPLFGAAVSEPYVRLKDAILAMDALIEPLQSREPKSMSDPGALGFASTVPVNIGT